MRWIGFRRRWRKALATGVVILVLYVVSYVILYGHRGPAANMAYFAYFPDAAAVPESVEKAMYYFFWPVYKVHRQFGGDRHNYDRYRGEYPADFKG